MAPTKLKDGNGPAPLAADRLRSTWLRRQGLTGATPTPVAAVLADTGWIPAAGSTGPILSLRARLGGGTRAAIEGVLTAGEAVLEVPGISGGQMYVPAADAPLALAAAAAEAERFIAAELGDIAFYGLDSRRSREQRLAAVRGAGRRGT